MVPRKFPSLVLLTSMENANIQRYYKLHKNTAFGARWLDVSEVIRSIDIRDFKIHYGEVLLRRLWPSETRVTTANFAPNSND